MLYPPPPTSLVGVGSSADPYTSLNERKTAGQKDEAPFNSPHPESPQGEMTIVVLPSCITPTCCCSLEPQGRREEELMILMLTSLQDLAKKDVVRWGSSGDRVGEGAW